MGSDKNRNKIEPAHGPFGTNFLFQFEPVIRNPDDTRVEVFSTFFLVRRCGIIQKWKKGPARSDAYFLRVETGLEGIPNGFPWRIA